METKDLVPVQNGAVAQPAAFFDLGPKDLVAHATAMAEPLADVINKQGLYSVIQGKKYVKVDGWQTLGNMLGILPKSKEVIEHPDGTYEAHVELVNYRTGQVVGGGSAICGTDEKRWKTADRFARRSMAITRATGKAYRLSFSWIMNMAGYEPTPLEEMPEPTSPQAVELYAGTDVQKRQLKKVFEELKITDKAVMKEISEAVNGKPMRELVHHVKEYIQNPL